MAHTAEQLHLVALEALARAAPVAEPAARELLRDVVDRQREPRGEALDDDGDRTPVGLSGGEEAQHQPARRRVASTSRASWARRSSTEPNRVWPRSQASMRTRACSVYRSPSKSRRWASTSSNPLSA